MNAALWQAEDEMRHCREVHELPIGNASEALTHGAITKKIVACAFRIQSLNDRRAELVGKINKEAGDPITEEKLHV